MTERDISGGTIKFGHNVGARFLIFEPPLSDSELHSLPLPATESHVHEFKYKSAAVTGNEMWVEFEPVAFEFGAESREEYAQRLAQHLGRTVV